MLVGVAGGGWRGGVTIALLGLGFAAYVATSARARCPACGGSLATLARERGDRAGTASLGQRRCPRCRIAFE